MRIERLEISGFKSFPDPVALEFHRGATAVVGPNGCGKSNIADAVVWVLGELGARAIRARGRDLIFAGSALRSPLGLAEVRLAVSGIHASPSPANGRIPDEEAARELVVSRRMDAEGHSIYSVNGRRSTRREVRRLFAGTGLAAHSYARIGQGHTNAVLTSRPEELRLLVEEAAGLGAYRINRKESEANLRAAARTLRQVRVRLAELARHIRRARQDARVAVRLRTAKERARLLDLAANAVRREMLLRELGEGSAPEASLKGERARRVASLDAFERHLDALRVRRDRTELELRRVTLELGELRGRAARAEALLAEGRRSAEARTRRIAGLRAEERELRSRAVQREADRGERECRARKLRAVLDGLAAEVADRLAARNGARQRERVGFATVSTERSQLSRLEELFRARQASTARWQQRRKRLKAARDLLLVNRARLEDRLRRLDEEAPRIEERHREQEARLSRLRERVARQESDRRSIRRQQEVARTAAEREHRSLEAIRARLNGVRALVVSRRQLGSGAAGLLRTARRERIPLGGAVGDSVETDPSDELAAERLLGIHRVRLDRASEVSPLVMAMADEADAPCELLVAELVEAAARLQAFPPSTDPDGPEGSEPLFNRVRVSDPLIVSAFPESFLVSDLETALRCFLQRPAAYATPQGVVVTPPGVVRFGDGGPGEGFLAARRELAELENRERGTSRRLERLAAECETARKSARATERVLETTREALARARLESGRLDLDAERARALVKRTRRRLRRASAEVSRNERALARGRTSAEEAAEALSRVGKELAEVRERLGQWQSSLESERETARKREREWHHADRQLAREQAVAEELERETRVWNRQSESDTGRLAAIGQERAALVTEEERWKLRRERARSERLATSRATAEKEAVEARLHRDRVGVFRRLEKAGDAMRLRRTELERVEERLASVRASRSRLRSVLDEMEGGFRRTAGRELADAAKEVPAKLLEQPLEVLERERASVAASMEGLGPVDATADVRLRELEEERDGLTAQVRDVERAMVDGLRAMERQDREAGRVFRECFGAVNAGFDKAFRQLFGGGRAELRLVSRSRTSGPAAGKGQPARARQLPSADERNGERDSSKAPPRTGEDALTRLPPGLDVGVEIAAEPPGKRLQGVRLLSGGEKAMTAIAFLIAVFRFRPAPFCLLDEVDAPLDDVNVRRFAALLRELRRDTQLVVITHNRLTMESCEHLYGVTMEEPGVSRLVSLRLGGDVGWIPEAVRPAPPGAASPERSA